MYLNLSVLKTTSDKKKRLAYFKISKYPFKEYINSFDTLYDLKFTIHGPFGVKLPIYNNFLSD